MESLERGSEALLNHAIELTYYMRGAVQYQDIMDLTFIERKLMMRFIRNRIKQEMDKVKDSKGRMNAIY